MRRIEFNPGEELSNEIDIVIRGETFRDGVDSQIDCIRSILELVVRPLVEDKRDVSCILTVYEHKLNFKIEELLLASGYFTSIYKCYCSRLVIRSQAQNFLSSLKASKGERSILVIRPDLLFKKMLPIESMFTDRFSFQWNYFHNSQTYEYADQIHFIGSSIKSEVIDLFSKNIDMLGKLSDGTGSHTLHNIYNLLSNDPFTKDKISYLVHYSLNKSHFEGSYCKLRGNPDYSTLNDLFEYKRIIRKLPIIIRLYYYFCRKIKI